MISPSRSRRSELQSSLDVPRSGRRLTREELSTYLVAALVAVHTGWLLRLLLDWNGILGSFLVSYLVFLGVHHVLQRQVVRPELAVDRTMTTLIWSAGVVVAAVLGWMLIFVLIKGVVRLRWSFLLEDLAEVGPLDPGGGARHAVIGTLQQVGIATVIVVPIAVLTAVYLNEIDGKLARPIRLVVDALAGVPSIVAGLLVFVLFGGYSGIRGALALLILMLPTVTRAAEEILRTVPEPLREASLALGAPRWRVVTQVVLPTARAGLTTAVLLGVARAAGETAPVLLTTGGATVSNANPFSGNQASLPTFIWDLIRVPDKTSNDRAWAAALLLVLIVLVLFTSVRWIGARNERRLGRR